MKLAEYHSNHQLQIQEATAIEIMKHWMNIQEYIYRHKSRVTWIRLGDSNTHYFFFVMKQRQNKNRIDSIYTDHGVLLKKNILL